MYWVSGIAFDPDNDKRPWLWHCNECEISYEKAMKVLESARELHCLLSGWIEKKNSNGESEVVYHKAYIDCFGRQIKRGEFDS